ncbi:maleylpyruvate isomerase family mycothiol-dependent enzyme [Lentzea alba]|uniref:maleylpyruvate isomerase family mycothiol-dependent enzyme n=1 Tax=Lentzea alba TaxID=2714351 RepID=UPI0039BF5C1C
MGLLSYEQRLATVVDETSLLVSALDGADLSVPVPACPGWTLNQLLRHLGYAHGWIEQLARERRPDADRSISRAHSVDDFAGETSAELGPWLVEGAERFSKAMLEVAAIDEIAMLRPGQSGPRFWSRRMAHETWVHRFDAFEALGLPFTVDKDVAWDGLWEWMNSTLQIIHELRPPFRDLLGQGHKLQVLATDYTNASHRWIVDLTGSAPVVRRDAVEKCDVTMRGPLIDLVLTLYRRRGPDGLDVSGDAALLKEFLSRARF